MPLTPPATATTALVTVIVPTHDHHETLPWAVRSVLDQTVADLQVVIIGDGATADVRREAHELCRADRRVVFEDHPKTPRRGEILRDRVIRASTSRFVAYNCDDDLWWPHHLETVLGRIGACDFVHPLPILIDPDGTPIFAASDLGNPDSVAWHMTGVPRNTISLSGVVHTREAYLRLPHGWRETPEGRWTDHYMWEQFFRQEWFAGVTSPVSTTLKLMAQGRDDLPPGGRRADIVAWWDRMHAPGFAGEWAEVVDAAVRRAAVAHHVESTARFDALSLVHARLAEQEQELKATRGALEDARAEQRRLLDQVETLRARLRAMRRSLSWRLTAPLRALRRAAARRSQSPR